MSLCDKATLFDWRVKCCLSRSVMCNHALTTQKTWSCWGKTIACQPWSDCGCCSFLHIHVKSCFWFASSICFGISTKHSSVLNGCHHIYASLMLSHIGDCNVGISRLYECCHIYASLMLSHIDDRNVGISRLS